MLYSPVCSHGFAVFVCDVEGLIACRILHKLTDNILRQIQDLVKESLAPWGVTSRGFCILGPLKHYFQHFEWWLLIGSNMHFTC